MSSRFIDILKYNLSGQLGSKLITFLINTYLIRHVNINLLGLINVRMTLLYNTIIFLVKEPFRKACLSNDLSIKESHFYTMLSIPFSFVIFGIFTFIWKLLGSPEVEYNDEYLKLIFVFASSALLELLVEPRAIYVLKTNNNAFFSLAQTILTLLQRLIAFVLIICTDISHVNCFCIAQIIASIVYVILYMFNYWNLKNIEGYNRNRYEKHYLKLIGSLMLHSMLKQALTDGAGYVMVFTNVLSLKMQGVYDIIERLGSLATRLVVAPLEESAFIYFSSNLKRGGVDSYKSQSELSHVSSTYFSVLKTIIYFGIVVLVFGIPYSSIVVKLYGGQVLVENNGHQMLDLYLLYLFIMAINGITECFAFASMGSNEIMSHGGFLFCSFLLHCILNIILSQSIGAYGFIIANCLNSGLRIIFNIHYIRKFMQSSMPSLKSLIPSFMFFILMFGSSFVIFISSLLFKPQSDDWLDIGAFIAIGGCLFILVLSYLHQIEHIFAIVEKQD